MDQGQGGEIRRQPVLSQDRRLEEQDSELYDGAFHDLLNDFGREAVVADIMNWIDARPAAN
jgi:alpha-beta hydrolase superfamily lysophospholipase